MNDQNGAATPGAAATPVTSDVVGEAATQAANAAIGEVADPTGTTSNDTQAIADAAAALAAEQAESGPGTAFGNPAQAAPADPNAAAAPTTGVSPLSFGAGLKGGDNNDENDEGDESEYAPGEVPG